MIAWPPFSGPKLEDGSGEPAADWLGSVGVAGASGVAVGVAGRLPEGFGVGTVTMSTLPASSPAAPTTAIWLVCGDRTTAWGGAPSSSGTGLPPTRVEQLWSVEVQTSPTSATTIEYLPSLVVSTQATWSAAGTLNGVEPGAVEPTAVWDPEGPAFGGLIGMPRGRIATTSTTA